MKEKLHISKKDFNISYKKNNLNQISQKEENNCIYRLYKDNNLFIHFQVNPETDEEQYFNLASKKNSMHYPYITQMNKQVNVISYRKTISNKDYIESMLNINDFIYNNFPKEKIDFSFAETQMRYTLTNNEKLHLNFEDGRNIFTISNDQDKKIYISSRDFNIDNLKNSIEIFAQITTNKEITYNNEILIFNTNSNLLRDSFKNILHPANFYSSVKKYKKISNKLTFYTSLDKDDKRNENDKILPFFDWEGNFNNNYKTYLINEGEFIKPYSDRKNAHNFEIENTACSYAEKENFPRLTLLGVAPKIKHKDFDNINNAIYINKCNTEESDGKLKINILDSYKCINGTLHPVKPFEITTTIDEFYGERLIDIIENNLFKSDLYGSIIIDGN